MSESVGARVEEGGSGHIRRKEAGREQGPHAYDAHSYDGHTYQGPAHAYAAHFTHTPLIPCDSPNFDSPHSKRMAHRCLSTLFCPLHTPHDMSPSWCPKVPTPTPVTP